MKRDNMIIYRSFYEAITELENFEDQAKIWQAIYELGFNGNEHIALTGIQKTIFKLIKPQIEANIKRYENGKKPKINKSESKDKQEISKSESNNNNNKNKNNNIKSLEDRKKDFSKYINSFKNEYSLQLLYDFFEYWTEHGENDKKMRFEKEKSFGVSRRLATWKKRSGDNYADPGTDSLLNHVKNQINEQRK